MEALAPRTTPAVRASTSPRTVDVALLGVGTVGTAFLKRVARLEAELPATRIRIVHVANSRRSLSARAGIDPRSARDAVGVAGTLSGSCIDAAGHALARSGCGIVIDATGSDAVAAEHAQWLANGVHVVTASKLGQGGSLDRWQAIQSACETAGTRYGDSATVGAGLPLLASLRALRDGGDRICSVAGVLSGSMAWLFGAFDGLRPFSGFVRQARDAGYTEPDPREDLSGEDVRRKLLILARAAGYALDVSSVRVESLVPASIASLPRAQLDARLDVLDAPLRERFAHAYRHGEKLRHIARLVARDGQIEARVGIESLAADDPLAAGAGTDNRVAIRCDRYCEQPLVIQGPGAGADVTAAALLDDVLRIARSVSSTR